MIALLLTGLSMGQTLIDFDNLAPGCNFYAENPLRTEYLSLGVEFAGPSSLDGGAVLDECGNFGVSGHSSPNFLAFNAGVGLANGGAANLPETVIFNPPATFVSLLAGYSGGGIATVTAFDATGAQVDQDAATVSSTLSLFQVSGTAISSVEIDYSGSILVVDDLYFETAPGGVDADGDGWDVYQDCNDADPTIHPGAAELCNQVDDDCDGVIPTDEFDLDYDGLSGCDGDCDDNDPAINPSASEVCDGVDNDCDGVLYAGEEDVDGDGVAACMGDCDDFDAATYPGAVESCDSVDNDCDGIVPADETDGDLDGVPLCANDCDDADPATYPGAVEVCDGLDNDCDGVVQAQELDDDADGMRQCDGDCDDADPTVYTGAAELCDGLDNDCSGQPDPDEVDDDADGFRACEDCDDADPNTYPGAPEVNGDGIDNDCDGVDGTVPTGTGTATGGTATGGTATGATGTGTGTADPVDDKPGGCGCSSTPTLPGLWLALPALFALRRR